MVTRCLGVSLGYPALGVINTVNWPSRLGGWATSRQPVTVRELTVRRHKLWIHNSHTVWNRPEQWEVINEMRLTTWNVCTLYRGEAMNVLVKREV